MAQVPQLLASSVSLAPPAARPALWQGARQGTPRGAARPAEERPRCVLFSPPGSGAHGHGAPQAPVGGCGCPGGADTPAPLTGGAHSVYVPHPRSAGTAAPPNGQGTLGGAGGSPEPPRAAARGVHPSPCAHGEGGVGSVRWDAGGQAAIRPPLPLRLALLAAVPKLPSLPLRCLSCSSPKAPGPGDLSRLPQLGFGSSNFRRFSVLLSRRSVEEKALVQGGEPGPSPPLPALSLSLSPARSRPVPAAPRRWWTLIRPCFKPVLSPGVRRGDAHGASARPDLLLPQGDAGQPLPWDPARPGQPPGGGSAPG